ncbi:MAG: lipopolysaccharide kinase InaA family protein [Candidatus Sumerlaeia bacterium]|nr:lipopolysaccharide kinase InaA family protein [Candidatus Sumerlaeia bacterium]
MHAHLRAWFTRELAQRAGADYRAREVDAHHVWSLPAAEALRPWEFPWKELRRDPERFPELQLVKMASRRTVLRTDATGEPLYVKRSLLRTPAERLAALVKPGKEFRETLLALDWRRAGILTPEPVCAAAGWNDQFGVPARYLATRALPATALELKPLLKAEDFEGPLWRALAEHTRDLHAAGCHHADYRCDHLFVEFVNESPRFWHIDLDGSHAGRPVSAGQRKTALARLFKSLENHRLTQARRDAFLAAYSTGT